jgi:multidrug resistance protein, MATE family
VTATPEATSVESPERWLTAGALVRLAVPAALSAILHSTYRPLDQIYAGFLGREAQGALGASVFVLIVAYGLCMLVAAGVGPLVGRATGRGDGAARRGWIGAGLAGASGVALVLLLVGIFAVDAIVGLLGLSGESGALAATYLRVILITGIALPFGPVIDASFAAMGNTTLPLALQAIVVALNAILTPVLMFGLDLGIGGAALGSTAAQALGVVVGLALLARATRLRLVDVGVGIGDLGVRLSRVAGIGLPVAVSTALYALVYWAMIATSIAPHGDAATAGLGIGFGALEAFAWPLYLGCSVSAASLVGRCLGAERPDLAWRAIRRLMPAQLALGVGVALVFWLAGPWLVGHIAADSDVAREAAVYALVLAWSQPAVSLEALFEGTLNGAGDTRASFWSTVPFNLLRVPLAWWLAFPMGMGPAGIWWAINLTTFLKAGTKGAMVWSGRWSRLAL